ncbi:MAG TPA: hypothetical protein VN940_10045 [Candidatus Dormibacteraeota bacterium]|nr:hypothetical protein [Candidatus Dormibacteraeota bacterium]
MATKTKAGVRTGKGGRRPPVKVQKGRDIPLLPIAVAGILLAFAIGVIIYTVVNNRPTPPPPTAANIPCDQLEHTQVHYHAALQILYHGTPLNIPSDAGRLSTCFYWLHVHAESAGVIHIESPANQTFTLGQFFAVWAASKGTPQPLDATHVSTLTLGPGDKLVVYVKEEGKDPVLYTGDPKAIVLKNHEVITLEITPPTVTPPPTFTFPSGL